MSIVMEHATDAVGLTRGSGKSTIHQQYDLNIAMKHWERILVIKR
ncbi:hypothetical protein [Sphingobacterium faecium]